MSVFDPILGPLSGYLSAYWGEILAVVLGGAILSLVGWLINRAWRPKITVNPIQQRPAGSSPTSFWWEMRNKGHNRCDELAVGVRIPMANFSQLYVSRLSLPRRYNVVMGYEYQEGSNPPHFRFDLRLHPFVEGIEVALRSVPDLELNWNTSCNIEIEYNYRDSGTYTRTFKLEIGPSSNPPLLKLSKISAIRKALKVGQ